MEEKFDATLKKLESIEYDIDDLRKIIIQVGTNMKTNFEVLEKKVYEKIEELKK